MQIRFHDRHFWWLIALLAWVSFLILAVSVYLHANWVIAFDHSIQQFAILVRQPGRTVFFKWLALLGTPTVNLIICLIITGWLWLRHEHFAAGWVMTAQIGINILTVIFKQILHRARPAAKLVTQSGYSFPSGHTTSTAIMVLIVLLIVVPLCRHFPWQLSLGLFSVIWLALIGFDRIYLFVHYPSDVLAGLCLALGWWSILRLTFGRAVTREQN
ncbi:phosphatase PAP2 family protein [Secundilactobacillus hailunensis]|uniref:Phosphatase PAP2 family protein n=1 Tax=Secundilactobacillus hailunensis TaxID=2559923 RepID=A0ABW1TA13_9LACO|nr:phosphatase PAP2 family protein [Secundilactobacillus hailunensis]